MENPNSLKPFRPDLFLETAEENEMEVSTPSVSLILWPAVGEGDGHVGTPGSTGCKAGIRLLAKPHSAQRPA